MPHPLTKTFDVLATTARPQAHEVLVAALDLPDESLRDRAVDGILRRDSPLGHVEILRRYASLSSSSRELVHAKAVRFKQAIEDALLRGDAAQRTAAGELVLAAERIEHLPTLIRLLEEESTISADWAIPVFREMVNRLYDHCRPYSETKKTGSYLRDSARIRRDVLTKMEKAWPGIEDREVLESFWEAILTLGDWNSDAVKSLLLQADDSVRQAAWDIVSTSAQPGVMQLTCDALAVSSPAPQAFQVLAGRSDAQFVAHLLRWLPKPPSQTQKKNLRQIQSVAWLDRSGSQLELIPEGLHCALVGFVDAAGLTNDEQLAIYEWLIRHGSIDARLAATESLASMRQGLLQSVLYESLDSDDGDVQAWATGQLREQKVPDAIPMLLARLDSPIDEVRETAREELRSCDLQHAMEWAESLSDSAGCALGEVLQKIDPQTVPRLTAELRNPIQRRRMRAVRAAHTLNLHVQVVPTLLGMLSDEDVNIRRAVVGILGDVPTSEVIDGLNAALHDRDSRVRESVGDALKNITRLNQQPATAVETGNEEG